MTKKPNNLIFVVSGSSGVGKTSLCKKLTDELDNLQLTVSHTTRSPRKLEQDGQDYYFVSSDDFNQMLQNDQFVEHAVVYGEQYGTSCRTINQILDGGSDVLLDIDYQGAEQVSARFDNVVKIFVMPPSFAELKKRLEGRKTEQQEEIKKRLQKSRVELSKIDDYHYLIINDNFNAAFSSLSCIINGERCRIKYQKKNVDLKNFF